jgi:hypothetical protein
MGGYWQAKGLRDSTSDGGIGQRVKDAPLSGDFIE